MAVGFDLCHLAPLVAVTSRNDGSLRQLARNTVVLGKEGKNHSCNVSLVSSRTGKRDRAEVRHWKLASQARLASPCISSLRTQPWPDSTKGLADAVEELRTQLDARGPRLLPARMCILRVSGRTARSNPVRSRPSSSIARSP